MVRLTKKIEYGLIAILYIALKAPGELTTARELSSHFSIPPELMGKVLQKLARHQIIASIQGVKGGYQIARQLEHIKISDVVSAVEGPIQVVSCVVAHGGQSCEQSYYCNIKKSMEIIQSRIIELFDSITLKELQEGQTPIKFARAKILKIPLKMSALNPDGI